MYERERFLLKTKNISHPIKKVKFFNLEDISAKKFINITNKIPLDDKKELVICSNYLWWHRKTLAAYEVLNYPKYIFDKDGFLIDNLQDRLWHWNSKESAMRKELPNCIIHRIVKNLCCRWYGFRFTKYK